MVDDLPIDNVLNNSLGSNGPILCTQNPHNSLNIGITQNLFSASTKNPARSNAMNVVGFLDRYLQVAQLIMHYQQAFGIAPGGGGASIIGST